MAPPSPFEVTSRHLAAVSKQMFPALLRRLLHAEADRHGIPADGIHVADNIDAPDGGEDGHICWNGEPERTRFLPGRFCQFQLKTGKTSPADAGNEVCTKGEVKCMIRSALEQDGYYIFLSTREYSQQLIQRREGRIREALRDAGLDIDDAQVQFRDAGQIAAWISAYPAVVTWLLEQVEGLLGPFRSYDQWAARAEHSESPWVNDERIDGLRGFLLDQAAIGEPQKVAHIIGLTAVGKSRLALEALCRFRSMVLYAVEGEAEPEILKATVQKLADSGKRAIVVVDQCTPKLHDRLSPMVSPTTSQLSLVTIDIDEPSGTLADSTYQVDQAPEAVTEAIVKCIAPDLSHLDQLRIVEFSGGFPGIAIWFAQAWNQSMPLGNAPDDELVETYVLRSGPYGEPKLLLQSAALLATFGDIGIEQEAPQLANIAGLGRNLSSKDLRTGLVRLARKGVARRSGEGKYVLLDFSPIAMGLAGRQWDEWGPDTWDAVLTDGSTSNTSAGRRSLCVQAAKRLKLLSALNVSRDVVKHVCRLGGPIDRLLKREEPVELYTIDEVLLHLVEVNRDAVADLLERALTKGKALSPLAIWNRYLAQTLAKIAFKADTFEDGARLLFRLVAAVNRSNVTRLFVDLFNPIGGSTEADGARRIELLDSVSSADNTRQLEVVVEALAAGLQIVGSTRPAEPGMHGTFPELNSWYPETKAEACAYVQGCAQRLIDFAIRSDLVGCHARKFLGRSLDPLIRCRFMDVAFIDVVERAVKRVGKAVDDWPEARDTLDRFLSDFSNDQLEKWEQQVQEWTEEQAKAQAWRKKRVAWAKEQLKQLEPK